jgi:Putative MetA-pathway of phenol degradation
MSSQNGAAAKSNLWPRQEKLVQAKLLLAYQPGLMFLAQTNIPMRARLLFTLYLLAVSCCGGAEAVREMSTDRPDTTESAYSVPAGMCQIEMSFFDYSRDANPGSASDLWIYGQINFKLGLTQSTDVQMIINSHSISGNSERVETLRTSGFGDVTLRLKKNLWGNDSGSTALAIMPYVTIPTHTRVSDRAWSGGLIMPFAMALSHRVSLGLMTEMDVVPDSATGGYDLEWLHSATLGYSLTQEWGAFIEVVGIAGEDTAFQALFDAGLTFAVTDQLILDAGLRLGLNRAAPDIGLFTGMSFRF